MTSLTPADTAEMYRNEAGVGQAVRASGLDRSEIFVTSKLSNASHQPEGVRRALQGTLDALGFDYLDLFLIHWPMPKANFLALLRQRELHQQAS